MGNIVNRVFDSSGPEGKVRGTPQQIIDKYNQLARDAQLGNDRVATENFQQHAEHYTRLLGEAQREQEARREQQDRDRQQNPPNAQPVSGADPQPAVGHPPQPRADAPPRDTGPAAQEDEQVIDIAPGERDSGLVDTPESKPKPSRRPRRSKGNGAAESSADDPSDTPEAAE